MVRLFILVNTVDVPSEVSPISKFSSADLAIKRLQLFMNSCNVLLKLGRMFKLGFAVMAFIRGVIFVNCSHMPLQVASSAEFFLTQMAKKRIPPFLNF